MADSQVVNDTQNQSLKVPIQLWGVKITSHGVDLVRGMGVENKYVSSVNLCKCFLITGEKNTKKIQQKQQAKHLIYELKQVSMCV